MNYAERLKAIQATRSRNNKIQLIAQGKDDPVFVSILKYAYDPFKHYYINKMCLPDTNEQNTLSNPMSSWTNLLDSLSIRLISGHEAKRHVKYFLSSQKKEDQRIFLNTLKKDLRCGISVKTINLAIPNLIRDYGAMKAHLFEEKRFVPGMFMSLKIEGNRAILDDGQLRSRNGIPIVGCDHILASVPLDFSSLDGELKDDSVHWQESSGDIRSHNKSPDQVLHVFDIPGHNGTFTERYEEMLKLDQLLSPDTPIKVVKHLKVNSLEAVHRNFEKALAAGYEGLVLKSPDHKYQTRRSYDWLKVKSTKEEDLPIVDVYEGEGKYEGSLGGVIVERDNGVLVRVGGGFSDDLRMAIWSDPNGFIGKTAEILYHETTPDGSLRHPRLGKGGIRRDK